MKKYNIIIFLVILIFSLLITYKFIYPHYSVDTIEMINNGYDEYSRSKFFQDGRICSGLMLYSIKNIQIETAIVILYIIGIIITNILIMYVYIIIKKIRRAKNKKQTIIILLISYITIFNYMYVDNFQFIEFPIIATSIFIYIIAANILYNKRENYILKTTICMIIATMCYQGSIGVFISFYILLQVIDKEKYSPKEKIKEIIKSIVIVCTEMIINLIFIAIYTKGSMTKRTEINIINNISNLYINLYNIICESVNLFPKYIQMILIFTIITIIYFSQSKERYIIIFKLLIIVIISIVSSIVMCLLVQCNTYELYGRIFFTLGATIGYMYIYLWCSKGICMQENKNLANKILIILLIIYFLIQTISIVSYCNYYRRGQEIDKNIMEEVGKQIIEYEDITGNVITKFAYIAQEPYEFIKNKSVQNIISKQSSNFKMTISKAFFKIWLKKDIENIIMEDEIYNTYFKNIDNEVSENQKLLFKEDTLYWVTY